MARTESADCVLDALQWNATGVWFHMSFSQARLRFCFLLVLVASCSRPDSPARFDLLITGGSVLDGNGTPPVRADVGIRDGLIAAVGDLTGADAARRIDASGMTVAPGFIDIHNHSDYTILSEPRSESMIRQGVTTMVLGESRSAGPVKPGVNDDPRARADHAAADWTTLGGYFERLARQRMATNIASYVGEEQVWTYVKGYGQSPAMPGELDEMKKLVAQAMEEGALGLSTSLLQPPSSLATTANLIELAKVAKQYGGIYSTHIRDEGEYVFQSVDEAIHVGKGAGIAVDIIHMKIAHKKLWGRADEIIAMVQRARDAGYNVQANVYPYTAGQNNLSSIVPPWAHDGGRARMLERLADPAARARMRREVLNGLPNWYNHYLATGDGWAGMLLVSLKHERNKPFQGRRMSDLIAARGGNPADVLFDVLIEEEGSVPTVFFHHSEQDMQLVMKQPWTSIGSDGSAVSPDGPSGRSHPHPRYYGTFPRVLGRYVRELNVLSLPEAVRKMTSLNADKIGVKDRGRLETGKFADVTIFDHNRVIDRATFEKPHQFPIGIPYVIVNGVVVIDNEQHTGALAGRVLSGPGKK
jgi:N-acyl-D-amino-acid deacylase